MGWCFEDQAGAVTDAALDALSGGEALVPAIWPLEVVNVLLVAERRKRIRRAETERFLELLAGLPIGVEPTPIGALSSNVLSRARECGLSAYDAAYLDLAARRGIPLATRDDALATACRRVGVPLFR